MHKARSPNIRVFSVQQAQRYVSVDPQFWLTDRYSKAIDQLGSDKLDVRIGGIYALERVARDSATDHPTVMEVLAAFVREHSCEQWPLPAGGATLQRATRPDVQAAITVIGRRKVSNDLRPIDFTGACLGHADFTDANLARAYVTGANLARANLAGANLAGAHLSVANLTSTYLGQANLAGTYLDATNLTGADLTGANLTGASFLEGEPVPKGWMRESGSGRLERTGGEHGDAPLSCLTPVRSYTKSGKLASAYLLGLRDWFLAA